LQAAAPADPELADVCHDIAERRARNMNLLISELASTGSLRQDMTFKEAADVLWATNSPEMYILRHRQVKDDQSQA
jgi:hypothetical protein